jgi:hypothetical protein
MSTQTITNFSHVNRLDIEEARQDLGMKLVGLWILARWWQTCCESVITPSRHLQNEA